jgi:glycosyltransferase involved in cell wall biosynthesis
MIDKTLLIVTTHFPPDARPGTHRVIRFIKYLVQLGWDVSVLTLTPECRLHKARQDPALMEKIPSSVKVYHTTAPRLCWPWTGLHSYLVPDIEATWIPFACHKGLKIIREAGIACLFSTAPPWTTHVICWWLKRHTGIKWVADIRDPWTRRPWMPAAIRRGVRYAILKKIERTMIHAADRVILNTEPLYQDFCSYYHEVEATKFLTIMNGIDPDDYRNLQAVSDSSNDRFVITHGGSLYRKRDPRPFLKAVSELVKDRAIAEDELLVQFIGGIDPEFDLPQWVRDFALEAVVRLEPPIPHEQYLQRLAASDLLLCIQPRTDLQVPSKLFEYMAVAKPVLVLTHDGATRDVVKQYGRGTVVEPEDVAGIKETILQLVHGACPMDDPPAARDGAIATFSGVSLAKELDKTLMECLAR